jgi:hypothetical protein
MVVLRVSLSHTITQERDANAKRAAEAIGAKHKYDTRSDRWYVILDSIETDRPIDGLLPLVWAWKEDRQVAESSKEVAKLFNSRQETKTTGDGWSC